MVINYRKNKMALKKYKPITAGTRWRIGNAYAEITTNDPEKSLLEPQKNTAGRNFQGRRVCATWVVETSIITVS
jgi:ribosomal protein L2